MKRNQIKYPILLLLIWLLSGCDPTVEPIRYGQDICSHCQMMIMDQKFGAELLTQKGKVYKFDSVECLLSFYNEGKTVAKDEVHSLWITPFDSPGKLIAAEQAVYLQSENLPSPMGMNLSGYTALEAARAMQQRVNGKILHWEELSARFNKLHHPMR